MLRVLWLPHSALKTSKALLMSSKLTVPPHMRWTYSGVMPARSIEQERISLSTNSRRRATKSSLNCYSSSCQCIYGCIKPCIMVYLSHCKISSGPVGSYGPSFTSIITVPLSKARTVCHWPIGMLRATTEPPGRNSIASVQRRSTSS